LPSTTDGAPTACQALLRKLRKTAGNKREDEKRKERSCAPLLIPSRWFASVLRLLFHPPRSLQLLLNRGCANHCGNHAGLSPGEFGSRTPGEGWWSGSSGRTTACLASMRLEFKQEKQAKRRTPSDMEPSRKPARSPRAPSLKPGRPPLWVNSDL
jgi:hypothetical protein